MEESRNVRRRSSLFKSTDDTDSKSESPSSVLTRYEKQLRTEIRGWTDLARNKFREIQRYQTLDVTLDSTLLTDEQKQYLQDGPTVDGYLKEVDDFNKYVVYYVAVKSHLSERCQYAVQEAQALVENRINDLVDSQTMHDDFP